jgi:hypothetical protein
LTTADLGALNVFAQQTNRLGSTTRYWTAGFNEKNQKDDGTFEWETEVPASIEDCILQGPHFINSTPFAQQPRPECKSKGDWDQLDLEMLPQDYVPRTNYRRLVSPEEYLRRQTDWEGRPYTERYREAHREFVGTASARTLQSILLPPGPAHIYTVNSIARENDRSTVRWASTLMSLPYDYLIKTSGTGHVTANVTDSLPIPDNNKILDNALMLRSLRLNCVTSSYSPLWNGLYDEVWGEDKFVAAEDAKIALGDVASSWSFDTPLRTDYERWLAMCEIDALVAMLLGLSEDQLLQMYRSQFAVLRKYENVMVFDGNGRQISADYHAHGFLQEKWEAEFKGSPTKRGETHMNIWNRVQAYLTGDTSMDLGPFVPPFRSADRELAMSRAFRAFVERMKAGE